MRPPRFDPMQFVNNITMVGFIFSALHRIIFISLFGSDRVRRATHWALYVGTHAMIECRAILFGSKSSKL